MKLKEIVLRYSIDESRFIRFLDANFLNYHKKLFGGIDISDTDVDRYVNLFFAKEEAKRKAEEEAKRKAEEETKRKAEEEAKRKAEEEAKRKTEEEAKNKAEEEQKRGQKKVLYKNNSGLWEKYYKSKHMYENEALKGFTLSATIAIAVDRFIELHAQFEGLSEIYAIRGIVNPEYEKYNSYAAAYNNDIVAAAGAVRPKLRKLLTENSVDPTALILYAMTGMFLDIPPAEGKEINHILLTLLHYEANGVDVSGCEDLWGQLVYTQDFEANYDSNQIDGKEITPIVFNKKREPKGFLTIEGINAVAEFVFMNMSKLDPEWMDLFSQKPLIAAGLQTIKNGITEDSWRLFNQNGSNEKTNDDDMKIYHEYKNLITTDFDRALENMISASIMKASFYGLSFIKSVFLAALLCLKLSDSKQHEDNDRELLDLCIDNLEEADCFPQGTTFETILSSFHRQMKITELYFLFFTVFYVVDYGDFRTIAENTYEKYK